MVNTDDDSSLVIFTLQQCSSIDIWVHFKYQLTGLSSIDRKACVVDERRRQACWLSMVGQLHLPFTVDCPASGKHQHGSSRNTPMQHSALHKPGRRSGGLSRYGRIVRQTVRGRHLEILQQHFLWCGRVQFSVSGHDVSDLQQVQVSCWPVWMPGVPVLGILWEHVPPI